MGSTLLKEIEIYKQDDLYVLLESVAEKNVSPITYHWYPAACGRDWEAIMPRICLMANEIYNGNLHWRGQRGKTYGFVTHAERMLENAVEIEGRIPHLHDFNIFYFKAEDPMADTWRKLERLDNYKVGKFFGEYTLRLQSPTIPSLAGAFQLRSAYERYLKNEREKLRPDYASLQKSLRESYSLPLELKTALATGE